MAGTVTSLQLLWCCSPLPLRLCKSRDAAPFSRRRVVLPPAVKAASATPALPLRGWSPARALQTRSESKGEAEDAEETRRCLQELADALSLPPRFLAELPSDIRVDLKDAAFALSSGAVSRECGERVGEVLLQVAQAWESGDTQSLETVAKSIPSLQQDLPESSKADLGKRLIDAGRRFKSTGQFGGGELLKIGNALIAAGEAVAAGSKPVETTTAVSSAKVFKFGSLQVEFSSGRAFTGAAIALAFGLLSWQLTQALQIIDNTANYANDNAIMVATSLRGALLALGYASSLLSAFSMVGLIALGVQLRSDGK